MCPISMPKIKSRISANSGRIGVIELARGM